jgi:hypothetical protein
MQNIRKSAIRKSAIRKSVVRSPRVRSPGSAVRAEPDEPAG